MDDSTEGCNREAQLIRPQGSFIHYSADPAKDPQGPNGDKWVKEERARMRADVDPARWRAEYELDFNAGSGDLVFPQFMRDREKLTFGHFKPSGTEVFYGGLDWGTKNKTAFVIVAEDVHGRFYSIFEKTWRMTPPIDVARDIRSHPLYEMLQTIYCDPAIQSHIVWNAKGSTTIAEMLSSREHVGDFALDRLAPAHGRLDSVFINMVRNFWVMDPPRWVISRECEETLGELANLSHPEHKHDTNAVEKIQDKNNHLYDASKYVFLSHPKAGTPVAPKPKIGTYGYLEEIENLAEGISSETGADEGSTFLKLYGMEL